MGGGLLVQWALYSVIGNDGLKLDDRDNQVEDVYTDGTLRGLRFGNGNGNWTVQTGRVFLVDLYRFLVGLRFRIQDMGE